MADSTLMFISAAKPVDELGENAKIALGILREDGFTIDRLEPNQRFLMVATPYYTRDEEKIVAARIQAMEAAHTHRMRELTYSLARFVFIAGIAPIAWGIYALFAGQLLNGCYCLLAAAIFSGMGGAIKIKEALRG